MRRALALIGQIARDGGRSGPTFGGHYGDYLSSGDVPRGSGKSPCDLLDAAIELISGERTDQEIGGALAETLQDDIGVVVSEKATDRHAGTASEGPSVHCHQACCCVEKSRKHSFGSKDRKRSRSCRRLGYAFRSWIGASGSPCASRGVTRTDALVRADQQGFVVSSVDDRHCGFFLLIGSAGRNLEPNRVSKKPKV